jgi:hypothetical protein
MLIVMYMKMFLEIFVKDKVQTGGRNVLYLVMVFREEFMMYLVMVFM